MFEHLFFRTSFFLTQNFWIFKSNNFFVEKRLSCIQAFLAWSAGLKNFFSSSFLENIDFSGFFRKTYRRDGGFGKKSQNYFRSKRGRFWRPMYLSDGYKYSRTRFRHIWDFFFQRPFFWKIDKGPPCVIFLKIRKNR